MMQTAGQHGRRGTAMVVVLVLISIMSIYLVSNAISLTVLKREMQLIEKKQEKRNAKSFHGEKRPLLPGGPGKTNTLPAAPRAGTEQGNLDP